MHVYSFSLSSYGRKIGNWIITFTLISWRTENRFSSRTPTRSSILFTPSNILCKRECSRYTSIFILCLFVCLSVCNQYTSKRLNGWGQHFVWYLTGQQGRFMDAQNYKKTTSNRNILKFHESNIINP